MNPRDSVKPQQPCAHVTQSLANLLCKCRPLKQRHLCLQWILCTQKISLNILGLKEVVSFHVKRALMSVYTLLLVNLVIVLAGLITWCSTQQLCSIQIQHHTSYRAFQVTAGFTVLVAVPFTVSQVHVFQFNVFHLVLDFYAPYLKNMLEVVTFTSQIHTTADRHIVHCTSKFCW